MPSQTWTDAPTSVASLCAGWSGISENDGVPALTLSQDGQGEGVGDREHKGALGVGRFLRGSRMMALLVQIHPANRVARVPCDGLVGSGCSNFRGLLSPATDHVVRGLSAIHDASVLHRDLRPSNVLLCGGAAAARWRIGAATLQSVEALGTRHRCCVTDADMPKTRSVRSRRSGLSLCEARARPRKCRGSVVPHER